MYGLLPSIPPPSRDVSPPPATTAPSTGPPGGFAEYLSAVSKRDGNTPDRATTASTGSFTPGDATAPHVERSGHESTRRKDTVDKDVSSRRGTERSVPKQAQTRSAEDATSADRSSKRSTSEVKDGEADPDEHEAAASEAGAQTSDEQTSVAQAASTKALAAQDTSKAARAVAGGSRDVGPAGVGTESGAGTEPEAAVPDGKDDADKGEAGRRKAAGRSSSEKTAFSKGISHDPDAGNAFRNTTEKGSTTAVREADASAEPFGETDAKTAQGAASRKAVSDSHDSDAAVRSGRVRIAEGADGSASSRAAAGRVDGTSRSDRLRPADGKTRIKDASRAGAVREPRKQPGTDSEVLREIQVNLSEDTALTDSAVGRTAHANQEGVGGDAPPVEPGDLRGDQTVLAARLDAQGAETPSRPPSVAQATATLARRLNGDLGQNIVRQARIMLQDAEKAELRLVIRPPELGRVRIQLQMDSGHIAGRILVDNGSVREVVEQNMAALQRAFEEAGLEMGEFEVSSGDDRGQNQASSDRHDANLRSSRRAGAESFDQRVEAISEYETGRHRVNLVA